MNKVNKTGFSNTSMKRLTDPLNLTDQPCSSLVVDGGWVHYMVKWEEGQTCQEIADSYLSYMQCLARLPENHCRLWWLYISSPKVHHHIQRNKNSCYNLWIRPNIIHLTPRWQIWSVMIHLTPRANSWTITLTTRVSSLTFRKHQITTEQCDNHADTSVVRVALTDATNDSVEVSIILCRYLFIPLASYFVIVVLTCRQKMQMCW